MTLKIELQTPFLTPIENNSTTKRMRCCTVTMILDWIVILINYAIYFVLFHGPIPTHKQCIAGETLKDNGSYKCSDIKDPNLDFPKLESTISSYTVNTISSVAWILLISINGILFKYYKKFNNNKDNNLFILKISEILIRTASFSVSSTMALGQIIKKSVGRPRPNYYNNNELPITSFPSLHAGISCAALFLLSKLFINSINFCEKYEKYRKLGIKKLLVIKHKNNFTNVKNNLSNESNNIHNQNNNNDSNIIHNMSNELETIAIINVGRNSEEFDYFTVWNVHSWFLLPVWVKLRFVTFIVLIQYKTNKTLKNIQN